MRFFLISIAWAVLLITSFVFSILWYYYDNVYSQVYQLPCTSKRAFCYVDQCFHPIPFSSCVFLFGIPLNSGQIVWDEPPSTPTWVIIVAVVTGVTAFLLSMFLCSCCLEEVELIRDDLSEGSQTRIIILDTSEESSRVVSQDSTSRETLLAGQASIFITSES